MSAKISIIKRPFPSFKISHFQTGAKCKTFIVVKINFIFWRIKNHFQVNGFALSFALKQRLKTTWAYTQLAHLT